MIKKRAVFVLLSATASTLVAGADPSPQIAAIPKPVQPRTLATGAPACGNLVTDMGYKSLAVPATAGGAACGTVKAILTGLDRGIREARETVGIFDLLGGDRTAALTLTPGGRPRS